MKLDDKQKKLALDAFKHQKDKLNWTFYEEREFLENLLQTRFNFLITVYAIFFNTFFLTKGDFSRIVILLTGFTITLLIFITICRIYKKVDVLLSVLYELDNKETEKYNTSQVIKDLLKEKDKEKKGVNKIIGFYIPLLLTLSFVIFGILICIGKFICPIFIK
jgi:hypothetical protein